MAESTKPVSIQEAFSTNKIVPDIIQEAPPKVLKITYDNNIEVNLGNKLAPKQVRVEPKYEWDANADDFYSLVFVDPDAPIPSKPFMGEMIHHLVLNIKGSDISTGRKVSSYKGSGPPPGTGNHRYIFFVLKQNDGEISDYTLKSKSNFKTKDFISKYNLSIIAGNFFLASFDSTVFGTWTKTLFGK